MEVEDFDLVAGVDLITLDANFDLAVLSALAAFVTWEYVAEDEDTDNLFCLWGTSSPSNSDSDSDSGSDSDSDSGSGAHLLPVSFSLDFFLNAIVM